MVMREEGIVSGDPQTVRTAVEREWVDAAQTSRRYVRDAPSTAIHRGERATSPLEERLLDRQNPVHRFLALQREQCAHPLQEIVGDRWFLHEVLHR